MIDTHVNFHHEAFAPDLADVIANAQAAGVDGFVSICDRLENVEKIAALVDGKPRYWRTVGVHPHYAKDFTDLTADTLAQLAEPKQVIGIGETGLDFHYGFSPEPDQIACFLAHVEAARQTGLTLVIHTRLADNIMAALLEAHAADGAFPILLHCYTSGEDLLRRALALGAFVSFSGIASFKNATEVRAMAEIVPIERLLVETDCPYLAPIPMRGRRNEPAFLPHVIGAIAHVKGVDAATLTQSADDAFFAAFPRAAEG